MNYVNEYGTIPEDIIGNYIDKLFEREVKEQKDADVPKHLEQYKDALGVLALSFMDEPFKRKEAAICIGKLKVVMAYPYLDSSSTIDLAIKMGLLKEVSTDDLQFVDHAFSDYFFACAAKEPYAKEI